MASTYSDRLKLELMETGANANTWGNNTNTNLETLDAFSAGYLSKSVAGSANVTLTSNNADPTAEASNKVIEFTGTLTGDITVFVPAVESNYIFFNNTSGAFTLTVAPTGHGANGSAIVQGAHTVQYCTGDTVVDLFANSLGNLSVKNNVNVVGTVNATSYAGDGSGLDNVGFASGTKMVFYQASAPTGWTQDTASALSNTVMSVVTGTGGGTGGSTSYFSSFLATTNKSAPAQPVSGSVSGTVGGTTLSTPTIASHTHTINRRDGNPTPGPAPTVTAGPAPSDTNTVTNATGGGGSHAHPFSGSLASATADVTIPAANVKYANVIVASKD
jgi:hypothetical protein